MTLRDKVRIIIFEADTKAGRRFDVTLIGLILLSVLTVMLDSVPQINAEYGQHFITQNGFLRCCLRWSTRCAFGVSSIRGVTPRASMG